MASCPRCRRCGACSRQGRGGLMSDFVEQCRREWKRLGVPDPLAAEMAADLAADLKEAEAEGVSAEELLGSSAFDPRSFAASWAAERGIIPAPPSRGNGRRRPLVLVAFTAACSDRVDRRSAAPPDRAAQGVSRRVQSRHDLLRHRRPLGPTRPRAGSTPVSSAQAHPPRSSGSCCCSRSSRSASPPGCGRVGAGHGHPPSPPNPHRRRADA